MPIPPVSPKIFVEITAENYRHTMRLCEQEFSRLGSRVATRISICFTLTPPALSQTLRRKSLLPDSHVRHPRHPTAASARRARPRLGQPPRRGDAPGHRPPRRALVHDAADSVGRARCEPRPRLRRDGRRHPRVSDAALLFPRRLFRAPPVAAARLEGVSPTALETDRPPLPPRHDHADAAHRRGLGLGGDADCAPSDASAIRRADPLLHSDRPPVVSRNADDTLCQRGTNRVGGAEAERVCVAASARRRVRLVHRATLQAAAARATDRALPVGRADAGRN